MAEEAVGQGWRGGREEIVDKKWRLSASVLKKRLAEK